MEILEKLFDSKTRARILKFFLNNPEGIFQTKEIANKVKVKSPSLQKELKKLKKIGFLKTTLRNKKRYYGLCQNFIFYPELKKIILKINPPSGTKILNQIKKLGKIKFALLSGLFVNFDKSPVDLFIVGENIRRAKLKNFLENLEAEIGKEINYVLMTNQEFLYRQNMCDKFIADLLEKPNKILINKIKTEKKSKK